MKGLDIGVMRVGFIRSSHARIFNELPNNKLVAIADSNKSKTMTIAENYKCDFTIAMGNY